MIELDLPYPPSVNALYAGKSRRYTSPKYKQWKTDATIALGRAPFVAGDVAVTYTFERPKNKDGKTSKVRRDLGNLEKAVSDILVAMGVIQDDSFIQKITLQWGKAPMGCRVELAEAGA